MTTESIQHVWHKLVESAVADEHDPELYLDAAETIRDLDASVRDLQAVVANQRAEIMRLRSFEASY